MLCGVAKDLTKLGGKTVTKLVTPSEKQGRLFKLVSLITGAQAGRRQGVRGKGGRRREAEGGRGRGRRGEGAARAAEGEEERQLRAGLVCAIFEAAGLCLAPPALPPSTFSLQDSTAMRHT